MILLIRGILWTGFAFTASHVAAAETDGADQNAVPVEVDTDDPRLTKVILIAGPPSHNAGEHESFAACALLRTMLLQTPGVHPVIVRDWPHTPTLLKNAKTIVFLADGFHEAGKYPREQFAQLLQACENGAGLCAIHYALHFPDAEGARIKPWLGGFYDWDVSCKGHWVAEFKPNEHPVCRGVKPVRWEDGWHFNFQFVDGLKGITPLLISAPPDKIRTTSGAKQSPGREEILAWAYERPTGGRAFAFSGMHLHKDWGEDNRRRLIVNGILWSAGLEIPTAGAPVELDPADLKKWLDRKPAKPAAK